jgi:hypothetical protein
MVGRLSGPYLILLLLLVGKVRRLNRLGIRRFRRIIVVSRVLALWPIAAMEHIVESCLLPAFLGSVKFLVTCRMRALGRHRHPRPAEVLVDLPYIIALVGLVSSCGI